MKFYNKLSVFLLIGIILSSCSKDDDEICVIDTSLEQTFSETITVNDNHHKVYTDIVINASVPEIWNVLTDFGNMPSWSTSFQGMSGDIRDGGTVTAVFIFPDPITGVPTAADYPHTLSYTEGVQFGWSDPILGLDGITDNHFYRIERISDCQSRLIQTDEFTGTNEFMTTEILASIVIVSYNQFNLELKNEVKK